jgi:hypothetical protein
VEALLSCPRITRCRVDWDRGFHLDSTVYKAPPIGNQRLLAGVEEAPPLGNQRLSLVMSEVPRQLSREIWVGLLEFRHVKNRQRFMGIRVFISYSNDRTIEDHWFHWFVTPNRQITQSDITKETIQLVQLAARHVLDPNVTISLNLSLLHGFLLNQRKGCNNTR